MGRNLMSAACAASLFALVAPAAAQDAAPDAPGNAPSAAPGAAPSYVPSAPVDVPSATPMFSMMDPTGDASKIEADATFALSTGQAKDGLLHGRLLAQLVAPEHIGGYVAISASAASLTSDFDTAINNLELGAVGQTTVSSILDLGLRVGVAIDTPGDDSSFLGPIAMLVLRPSDLGTTTSATLARASVSATVHQGAGFARVDLGLDVTVDDRHDKLGHLNIGFGYQANKLATTVELQTLRVIDGSGDTVGAAGLSVRYVDRRVSPYARVSTPFGDVFGVGDVVGFTVGAAFAL